jgi:hypothetical protein
VVACTPHPGYGTVSVRSGATVRHVELATCRSWRTRASVRFRVPTLTVSVDRTAGTEMILDRGRVIYRHRRREGPIELFGASPGGAWVLFAIDPQGSASLAADGLGLEAVSTRTGKVRHVTDGLLYRDYRGWCDGKLVLTAGGDRIASNNKRLIVTQPPDWKVQTVVRAPRRAFGAMACWGSDVVVQTAPASATTMNPRWELWVVAVDTGKHVVIDRPPPGWSDDSPRVDHGRIVFIRSRRGDGTLWAYRVGPLAAVGHDDGFYGHRAWSNVAWSLQR